MQVCKLRKGWSRAPWNSLDLTCKRHDLAIKRPKLQMICWAMGSDVRDWRLRMWLGGRKPDMSYTVDIVVVHVLSLHFYIFLVASKAAFIPVILTCQDKWKWCLLSFIRDVNLPRLCRMCLECSNLYTKEKDHFFKLSYEIWQHFFTQNICWVGSRTKPFLLVWKNAFAFVRGASYIWSSSEMIRTKIIWKAKVML